VAVFIDAIVVKVRDGQVANRPIDAAIDVTLDGDKDVLGLWAATGGEGAKLWMSVLTFHDLAHCPLHRWRRPDVTCACAAPGRWRSAEPRGPR
jgi:hypothetical protein